MPTKGEVNILLVEDDEVDVRIVKEAFKEHKLKNPLHVASDGVEGLEMLRGENGRERLPRPYLIMLDLKMPRMNGLEFLAEIRKDPQLKDSIVFVLTTSDNEQDKVAAYKSHVAGYLLKSDVGGDFMTAVQMLELFVVSVQFPESR
jgi:CheY-like chemotaxis protein